MMVDHLIRFWPRLWSWLKHLHDDCITNPATYSSEKRRLYKSKFIDAVDPFCGEERIDACLWSTPGVVPTLINIWCLEIRDPGLSLITDIGRPDTSLTSAILDAYFSAMFEKPCQSWIDNVVIPSRGNPKDFALVALVHLRHDLKQKQPDLRGLIHDIRVITSSSCYRPFRDTLLSLNSVHDVTRVMVNRTSQPYSAKDAVLVGMSINCCFWYLVGQLESTDGTPWIIQALDAHLLCALLKCEPWLEQLEHPYLDILSDILPKYLIHCSVLSAASRALARVRDLQLETAVSKTGPLWIKWSNFRDLVDDGVSVLREASQSPDGLVCSNERVRTVHFPSAFNTNDGQ